MQVSSSANSVQALNQYQLQNVSKPESSAQTTLQEPTTNSDNDAVEANRDSQRESATNALANQSKKSQVEISLATVTEGTNNSIENNTADIIESLRDVQKQNNAVQAHATYQENQNAPVNNLARGLAG